MAASRALPHLRRLVALAAVAALAALLGGSLRSSASAYPDTDAGLFDITNRERNAHGLASLAYDPAASAVARTWSQTMAATGQLVHNPNLVAQIATQVTGAWQRVGENIGHGGSIDGLHRAFMNSPGHRANVLGDYNRVGVAVVRASSGALWVTLDFVKGPALSSTPPPQPTAPVLHKAVDRRSGAVVRDDGSVELSERAGNGSVVLRTKRNGQWSGWQSLGGGTDRAPDLSSWGSDRLDVFIAGLDGALWHRSQQGGTWSPWESLGGRLTSAPSAVSWGAGRIDVVARGMDGAVWSRAFDGGRWGGWYSMGGQSAHAAEITSWAPGRLDLFAVGSDNQMWHKAWVGTGFTGWEPLGGRFTSAPGATSPGSGRIDVFGRGLDNSTWSLSWNGRNWTAWWPLGGISRSAPEAASGPNGHLHVFVDGQDLRTWERAMSTSWAPWSVVA